MSVKLNYQKQVRLLLHWILCFIVGDIYDITWHNLCIKIRYLASQLYYLSHIYTYTYTHHIPQRDHQSWVAFTTVKRNMTREKTTVSNQFSSSNFAKIVTSRDGKSGREGWREIECVSERARRTCCVTYAALQTSQIILSCICIMCIGMATHLDRKSTCTVIETNMVILFSAYLDYFSLTNQSREVTCDFGFASGVGAGCDGCYDDRDFLKSSLLLSSYAIVKNNSIFPLTEKYKNTKKFNRYWRII